MAFDDLKKDLMEANADIKSYLEYSEEYLKLKVFKLFMVSLTSFSHILLIGALGLLALFFLSASLCLALGAWLKNPVYGYLIVGLIYVVGAVLAFVFRAQLDKPIIRKFSKYFFDKD